MPARTAKPAAALVVATVGAMNPSMYLDSDLIWELADAMPDHLRLSVLIAAYAGLRNAELCGLRLVDVNPLQETITPAVQYPEKPLKTGSSSATIPVPTWLAEEITAHIAAGYAGDTHLFVNEWGDQAAPWLLQRAIRSARRKVKGLPGDFRLHDARHHYASILIAKGGSVKTVQRRMRHAKATTTLDVYTDLFDMADQETRDALAGEQRPRKIAGA